MLAITKFWLHERIKLANKNLWFGFKLWCSTQWTFSFHADCWKTLEYWGPCTEGNRFWKGNCVIIDLKEKRKGVETRNLFITATKLSRTVKWLLKTLNEGTNNTANTRGGADGLNLWRIEKDCDFGFWKLVSLTRFLNSFLVFVTFDIMLRSHICLTWSCNNCHSQVISQVPRRIRMRNWHYKQKWTRQLWQNLFNCCFDVSRKVFWSVLCHITCILSNTSLLLHLLARSLLLVLSFAPIIPTFPNSNSDRNQVD